MSKKIYTIPVVWQMIGTITIEADNFDSAIDAAKEADLPEGSYLENSFEIDYEGISEK